MAYVIKGRIASLVELASKKVLLKLSLPATNQYTIDADKCIDCGACLALARLTLQ